MNGFGFTGLMDTSSRGAWDPAGREQGNFSIPSARWRSRPGGFAKKLAEEIHQQFIRRRCREGRGKAAQGDARPLAG